MTTLLLSFALMGLIMLAMAIGVMVSGRRLRGSCGGQASCHCKIEGLPLGSCDRPAEPSAVE